MNYKTYILKAILELDEMKIGKGRVDLTSEDPTVLSELEMLDPHSYYKFLFSLAVQTLNMTIREIELNNIMKKEKALEAAISMLKEVLALDATPTPIKPHIKPYQ